jgi:hypothetical protein
MLHSFKILLTMIFSIAEVIACDPSIGEVGNDIVLRLPFRPGEEYKVTQGYCSDGGDHTGYQVDFNLPSGTPVLDSIPINLSP